MALFKLFTNEDEKTGIQCVAVKTDMYPDAEIGTTIKHEHENGAMYIAPYDINNGIVHGHVIMGLQKSKPSEKVGH